MRSRGVKRFPGVCVRAEMPLRSAFYPRAHHRPFDVLVFVREDARKAGIRECRYVAEPRNDRPQRGISGD